MKKFENFQRALRNLEEIRKCKEPYEMIVLMGQVALFEICFEQSWKAMKELLEYNGYDESRTGSPRSILKLAYQAGMIDDEELWVEALASRNNVSHAYNEGIATKIVSETKAKYIDMFEALEEKVQSDWVSV
ncbi:MAG: nucleotidyltransferase substrate binding protein [Firmicutes bacterium]|nr:nucleotidyltransferase substrate binding protein [Bacillota bacterium]